MGLSLAGAPALAASFNISSSDSTTAQTLGSGSGQTGSVAAGKSLTVSGGTVAVTVSGNNATLNNLGTLSQTGNGRVIRDNTGVTGLLINNGSSSNASALMMSADADVIQMNKSPASVTLNNYGQLISLNASGGGSQAVDFNAIISGSNVVNNYAGGLIKANEADAVRPGVNGSVNNWGTIQSLTPTGSSSDGVDAQSNSGVQINNYGGALIEGGRAGIAGGAADASASFVMLVNNQAGATIRGLDGAGFNLDGFNAKQLVTIVNQGSIIGNGVTRDGDGIDVDGLVHLTNTGLIRSVNAFSPTGSGLAFSEGVSVGGGTIINSGTIEGWVAAGNGNAVGRGISLVGNDISSGPLAGTREGIYANTGVTNQAGGVIRGQSDSAIFVGGAATAYTVVIRNEAGATLQGGGSLTAAVVAGPNAASIDNAGRIDGASSGRAVQFGAAGSSFTISGGSAVVLGSIDGGVGLGNAVHLDPGNGQGFAYDGAFAHFASVQVHSGTVTLSGQSNDTGQIVIDAGATLVLAGADRLGADSSLVLKGGVLQLSNAAGSLGQSFASLVLADSSVLALGGSALSFDSLGSVAAGKTLTVQGYQASAGAGYALRLRGDYSGNADFQALMAGSTVNGLATRYSFNGVYTEVSAVPEPQSLALMLAGLGIVAWVARRRAASSVV